MIAAWMVSAVLVGLVVMAGAMAADRVFVALRRQTRFVWLAAMGITLAWPLLAYARARGAVGSTAAAPLKASVQQLTAIVVRASESSLHVRADVVLLIGWTLLSAILLARMFVTVRALRVRGRGWRSEQVDGVHIRLSRDVGPAVVGLDPMEVVLPEWALELEPPLRALVLAHEEEHRRARDPHLLLLSAALIALVPWNPALWLQARRLRLAIELDCDARVLRSHPRPERYGLLLLAIAQRRTAGTSLLAAALTEPTSNLERRINAMNNPWKKESRVRLAVLGGIAIAAVAVACAVDAPASPTAAREQVPTRLTNATALHEFQVEKTAAWIQGTGVPSYPEALKAAGVEGQGLVQFVVDTDGRVDSASVRVLKSTNTSFADAIRAALPRMRFTPAEVGGHAVRQVVQQSFVFSVK